MRLPHELDKLKRLDLTTRALRTAISEARLRIRTHRDTEKPDDRCHLDDYLVWDLLDDSPPAPTDFEYEESMELCKNFWTFRRAGEADPIPKRAIRDRRLWDQDLRSPLMTRKGLLDELFKIQQAIKKHRDIGRRHRTVEDDRLLYTVLPEKMPGDFRLPTRPEFLGEAKAPHAGCPAFWRSHSTCKPPHNLHKWGPCN